MQVVFEWKWRRENQYQPLENKATEIFTNFQHSENTQKAIKAKVQTNMDKSCVRESIYKPVTKFPDIAQNGKYRNLSKT